MAAHLSTVFDEELGRSDGDPGQTFVLQQHPILPRRPNAPVPETVEVETADGSFEQWEEVDRFADSSPADSHFMVDDHSGEVRFGPRLRDALGHERQYGRVPAEGRLIRFARYRIGGGTLGNVGRGSLVIPRSSSNLDYVKSVTNLRPAVGGRDAETLEEQILRGPDLVRTREVAVTRSDYEKLTVERFPQAAQVRCTVGTAADTGARYVRLLVVPVLPAIDDYLTPEQLGMGQGSRQLAREIRAYLQERAPLTTEVLVTWADYHWVSVYARLLMRSQPGLAPFELEAVRNRIRTEVQRRLYRFIHPSSGGPEGAGWPFGRSITQGDVFPLLETVPGVRYVAEVKLRSATFGPAGRTLGPDGSVVQVGETEVVCSDVHVVEIGEE